MPIIFVFIRNAVNCLMELSVIIFIYLLIYEHAMHIVGIFQWRPCAMAITN